MGTGAAVTMAWSHHRLMGMLERGGPFHHEMRMRALERTLQLSAEQRNAISAILERDAPIRRKLTNDAMQSCGEPLRSHKAQIDAEIRAVLRPDQQVRFDELAKRQAERFYMGLPHGTQGPAPGVNEPAR